MDRIEICYEYSRAMEHHKWMSLIPSIPMKEGWHVSVLPPRDGALCRMRINGYSIYLDAYDHLGYVNSPYWEVYDGEECHRFMIHDVEGLVEFIDTLPIREM